MRYSKVTMIDDSRTDAQLLRRAVSRQSKEVEFNWIGDAEEGLEYLLNQPVREDELVLLDIKMPKLTGLEILERLAAKKKLPPDPNIVVLSSSDLKRDMDVVATFGGIGYRCKPGGYHEIISMVSDLMGADTTADN